MIPLVKSFIPEKGVLMPEIERVLYSGYIAQGEEVDAFEKKFSKWLGVNNFVSLNSGTAALHIALILANVKPGDEVISTALTAEPTNVAIKQVGAIIKYADIDITTGNISPSSIKSVISERTKAILVVDYAGNAVDIQQILLVSKSYNIPVIRDSAHGLGTTFEDKLPGHHFDFTVFSFQAIKHLTTIDGGALVIEDDELYEKAKLLRWFGLDKKLSRLQNDIREVGYKYHMNNINAVVGSVQLDYIDAILSKYRSNGKYFDANFNNINGVKTLEYYPDSKSSYWLYTLRVENRNDFILRMKENGIIVSELHLRNDMHTLLKDESACLPNLNEFYADMVHIPCGWWVTEEDRERIVSLVKEGW